MFGMVSIMLVLLFISGCGYRFAGTAPDRLISGQSLWVSFIGVEIDSPSAQTVIRRAILEECHALRGLYPAGDSAVADLRVSGNLRSYAARAVSYTSLDQVREYRLTLDVDLEFFRKGQTVPFWKGTVQGHQDYPANKDLALQRSAEETALASASHNLARKFLMSVEQAY
jgi:outer membrane lipopolysaccharide assembly protein LptE/RlpB